MRRDSLRNIIDEQDGGRVAIEGLYDRSKSLLSCSIPNLQAHFVVVVDLDGLALELCSESDCVLRREEVLDVAGKQAALTGA